MISIIHNQNIKAFDDLASHLKLEVERLEASKATKVARSRSNYLAHKI